MSAPSQIKTAPITASSSGDNTIVAASTGNPIKVWKVAFTAAGAVNVIFKDGASTSLSGAIRLTADGSSLVFDGPEGFPVLSTTVGNAFIINLSGAVAITGMVWFSLG